MKPVIFLLWSALVSQVFAGDTLFTNPHYPPLVYARGEYDFYKYTPRYVPEDMLQCFRILATSGDLVLNRFKERDQSEVIERGMFERGYRLRKEFCLEGYSPFVHYFFRRGIYYPYAMQTYILLCFHQYLRGERISWNRNKSFALEGRGADNRAWKRRARRIYKKMDAAEAEIVNSEPVNDNPEDWYFQW